MSSSTLSKKLASVKPGTVFVGVDLALDRNGAVVLTEHAEQLARFGFPNEQEGYDYFYRHLETIQERQQACEGYKTPHYQRGFEQTRALRCRNLLLNLRKIKLA